MPEDIISNTVQRIYIMSDYQLLLVNLINFYFAILFYDFMKHSFTIHRFSQWISNTYQVKGKIKVKCLDEFQYELKLSTDSNTVSDANSNLIFSKVHLCSPQIQNCTIPQMWPASINNTNGIWWFIELTLMHF